MTAYAEARPLAGFAPADHVRILHPEGRRGIATVARGGERWTERAVPIADLAHHVADMAGEADLFLSQQSFYGWRRIAQLAQLGATYVDLDFHRTARWAGSSPELVTEAVLRTLDDAGAPGPSYVLSTGRGLLALWLHGLVPRAALPRWTAVQRRLAQVLAPFGADLRALDAARVFRLAGTENPKAKATVRPTYLAAAPAALWRWDFEDLAREVLPRERAEIVSLNARRAERAARGQGPAPARTLTAATYWEAVLADLQRLRAKPAGSARCRPASATAPALKAPLRPSRAGRRAPGSGAARRSACPPSARWGGGVAGSSRKRRSGRVARSACDRQSRSDHLRLGGALVARSGPGQGFACVDVKIRAPGRSRTQKPQRFRVSSRTFAPGRERRRCAAPT